MRLSFAQAQRERDETSCERAFAPLRAQRIVGGGGGRLRVLPRDELRRKSASRIHSRGVKMAEARLFREKERRNGRWGGWNWLLPPPPPLLLAADAGGNF